MKMLLAMLPTVILVVYSQLITKWRVVHLASDIGNLPDKLDRLGVYLKDPYVLSSYGAALLGSAAWMFVVERYEISIAFPVYVGLTVMFVAIGSGILFNEQLSLARGLSISLIVVGVAIGSRA